jgi:hypothetical protein
MTWSLQLLQRLVDAFAPPEPISASRQADRGEAPATDDDYVEMAIERELRILMAHWL